ncbi:uncharacterized protein LOC133921817 [Phragmites australis]|uniref:uncharacterized protein LOC133921817 n=1 Tax=Phragmites australis TaxID=29695 RepID=UPI002D785400|nr:uncharacterized protein LOC133921817 [Phragmites australis]XP_062222843.1 uncharacterized protein LOC133921817 [Phragmites australis]XP_062222844.1 uncharacterized protein LOC133921817 [Phragmites australis]
MPDPIPHATPRHEPYSGSASQDSWRRLLNTSRSPVSKSTTPPNIDMEGGGAGGSGAGGCAGGGGVAGGSVGDCAGVGAGSFAGVDAGGSAGGGSGSGVGEGGSGLQHPVRLFYESFTTKLSDFRLAQLGQAGSNALVSSPMMSSFGYCTPEYDRGGQVTMKSDVYSFGVMLLQLISGRRAVDTSKFVEEKNVVTWAMPVFKDQKRCHELIDPLIKKEYLAIGGNGKGQRQR